HLVWALSSTAIGWTKRTRPIKSAACATATTPRRCEWWNRAGSGRFFERHDDCRQKRKGSVLVSGQPSCRKSAHGCQSCVVKGGTRNQSSDVSRGRRNAVLVAVARLDAKRVGDG